MSFRSPRAAATRWNLALFGAACSDSSYSYFMESGCRLLSPDPVVLSDCYFFVHDRVGIVELRFYLRASIDLGPLETSSLFYGEITRM